MKRWSIILGLAVVAAALSPWASALPDGLESAIQHLGLSLPAGTTGIRAPLPDYALPGHEHSTAAGSLVGIAGTLFVFVSAYGLGHLLAGRRRISER